MAYKFVRLSAKYLPSFEKLIKISFPLQSTNVRALVQWKFLSRRMSRKAVTYIAVNDDGQVVSQYSNIPITVSHTNILYDAMVCADMSTLKEHRGKGLISQLSKLVYKDVSEQGAFLSIGASNAQGVLVDKNSSGYGYHIVGAFLNYFKIVLHKKKVNLQCNEVFDFRSDFKLVQTQYFQINKTYEYLRWRYKLKPESDYKIFEVFEKDKLIGYIVLRVKSGKIYVYEMLNFSKLPLKSFLLLVENYAYTIHHYLVIYRVLDNNYWSEIFSDGHYIRSITTKTKYYFTVKIHNKSLLKKTVLNKDSWIITNGDIY